jgi:hypothetical protein
LIPFKPLSLQESAGFSKESNQKPKLIIMSIDFPKERKKLSMPGAIVKK